MDVKVCRYVDGRWEVIQHSTRTVEPGAVVIDFAGIRQRFNRHNGNLSPRSEGPDRRFDPMILRPELDRINATIDRAADLVVAKIWGRA